MFSYLVFTAASELPATPPGRPPKGKRRRSKKKKRPQGLDLPAGTPPDRFVRTGPSHDASAAPERIC
jgi:hypothetical protein